MNTFILSATHRLQHALREQRGVTALEYGLIAALIAVVIIASLKLVGTNMASAFSFIASNA